MAAPSEILKLKAKKERRMSTTGLPPGGLKSFDAHSLMKVTADDLYQELEAFKKTKSRLERSNEKLSQDIEYAQQNSERWEGELKALEKKSRDTLSSLETQLQKERFDWKNEKKNLDSQLDKLLAKLDDLENDLDDQLERTQAQQDKEIQTLNEDLNKINKAADQLKITYQKLETHLRDVEDMRDNADRTSKLLKKDILASEEELNRAKIDSSKYQTKVEDLRKVEKQLSVMEEERDETQADLQSAQKMLRKLEKEIEAAKPEINQIADLKNEIEDWNTRNTKIETELEKLKNDLKYLEQTREKKGLSATVSSDRPSRRAGREEDTKDVSSQQRSAQREIEELEDKVKEIERQFAAKRMDIEDKIEVFVTEQKKHETRSERANEEIAQLKQEYLKVREHSMKDEAEITEKLAAVETEYKRLTRDLEAVRKELLRNSKDVEDTRSTLSEQKFTLTQTLHNIAKSESILSHYDTVLATMGKERRLNTEMFNMVTLELNETSEKLSNTQAHLSNLQAEYKEFQSVNERMIAKLEEEHFEEMRKSEEQTKLRWKLEKELDMMRMYFRPGVGQSSIVVDNQEDQRVAVEKWWESIREERLDELKKVRDKLKSVKPKDRSLQELQEAFQRSIGLLSPDERDDLGFELEDLNFLMNKLAIPTKDRFNLFVTLVEEKVDTGIVRELGLLFELQNSSEGLHPLRTPMHIVFLTKKDIRMDPTKKFRDALLERLVQERYQRTRKDPRKCQIVILEGGDHDEEDDIDD
eukprot:TRINITY_DN7459_c0_g1_i1.p1 TRINITY_DN7459_c0_g1~~TRINITY_DN7459_c0_g1_i1.p1  ORF type:complete len:757 (-),score=190.64 TRINITY_DN7459_c0_g1_i1:161-2431(-)